MWHELIPAAIWEAIGFILKCFGLIGSLIFFVWFLFREEPENRGLEHNPLPPKEPLWRRVRSKIRKIRNIFS